jgi:uncharacterized linocin/CFP29 family protein
MSVQTLIGASDILSRGVSDLSQLRPVLDDAIAANADSFMAANASLRKDEWEMVDMRVNDVMRERLTIVDDLRAKGLIVPTSIGTILRVTERLSDMAAAEVNYDGDSDPDEDKAAYLRNVVPVPVISKGFRINWRQLEASRRRGDPLDVTNAAVAARKVRDKLQDVITNGYGTGPGANPANGADGQTIPGLTTAAGRLLVSLGTAWDVSGADIIGNVLAMLESAYASNLFGPFNLYVPKNYWATLQEDYSALKGDRTMLQRIEAFENIDVVRPLDSLADDNVVMVQMTEDVIDMTEAQTVTTVQWEKNPFVTYFRVMTVAGPQIKSIETDAGATINGIIHLS